MQDGDAIVQVYQRGDKFDGKIVWLKTPLNRLGEPMKDTNNVDWKLRAKPAMGLVILKDFVFTEDGNWEDGTVYDPKNGKTYKCIIKAVDRNRLEIRGYIGISLLGRTEIWKRNE